MHETSIVQSLIELIEEQLARQRVARVTTVHLRIGPLSGVVSDALQFAFNACAPGTIIDGARLRIEETPLIALCQLCGPQRIESPQRLCCPVCTTPTTDITSGRELELASLEVLDHNEIQHAC